MRPGGGYDALVVATGGAARTLPGTEDFSGVHALRTWDDALAVRSALDAGARTVVTGAGFIGSEVASSARKRGLPATIVETLPVPLVRSVGEDMGKACADLHRAHGTDLRCGETVDGLESSGGAVTGVRLGSGEVVPADLVVVGIGVSPCTGWLEGSGIELNERDRGVVAAATLRAADGVYAAGDVVHFPNHLFDGEVMRLEHWTTAAEQGAVAARNALDPANVTELGTGRTSGRTGTPVGSSSSAGPRPTRSGWCPPSRATTASSRSTGAATGWSGRSRSTGPPRS